MANLCSRQLYKEKKTKNKQTMETFEWHIVKQLVADS